eukprot:14007392-Heterocapsa_arctica.AAC.1
MSDRMRVAQEAWGGLWVVDVGDLPQFDDDEMMEPITADELRRCEQVSGWKGQRSRCLEPCGIESTVSNARTGTC